MKNNKGFTLIELIVVVAIISILASLVIIRIVNTQQDARNKKVLNDFAEIKKTITIAKTKNSKTLIDITGKVWSDQFCHNRDLRDLHNINPLDQCIVDLKNAFKKVEEAGGISISGELPIDPWGSVYLIDENENENGICANKDRIKSAGPDGISGNSDDIYSSPRIDNVICPN